MKKILVPLGPSKNAVYTLQYAIDFFQGTDAVLYVIKIFTGSQAAVVSFKNLDAILEDDTNREMEEVLSKVDTKGVQIISKSIKGNINDSIERVADQLDIDLIIVSAKAVSKDDDVYLGNITGGLIKNTNVPMLILPKKYKYKKVSKVLMAIKSGVLDSPEILVPLKDILFKFGATLDLIRVIVPESTEEDAVIDEELKSLATNYKTSENATVFQGVLEHIHSVEPDMLCAIRRKRGFFNRLFEQNRILKKDFESRMPLLVLKASEREL